MAKTTVWEDAMHKVVSTTAETDEELQQAAEELNQSFPTHAEYLSNLKSTLSQMLERDGYPRAETPIFYKGQFWCERAKGERQRNVGVSFGWGYAKENSEPLKLHFEIARIYMEVLSLETAISKSNIQAIFFHSHSLGRLTSQFNLRQLHLRNVTRGKKVAGGSRNSAHETNKRHEAMRKARFDRMQELVPEVGVEKAAAQCEVEGLGSWQAIKKQWNRRKSGTPRPLSR